MCLKNFFQGIFWLGVVFLLSGSLWGCRKLITDEDETETINYGNLSGKIGFFRESGKIIVIDFDNKNVTKMPPKEDLMGLFDASVSFSPDGVKVAVSNWVSRPDNPYIGFYQLFTVFVNNGSSNQLTSTEWTDHICPVWSSNGTNLYYLCNFNYNPGNSGNIYKMNLNGGDISKITDFVVFSRISVSKDETFILLSYQTKMQKGANYNVICSYNIKNKTLNQLTSNDSTFSAYSPVLSPDEQKIAYVIRHTYWEFGTTPYYSKIMIMNIDGSSEKTIVTLPCENYLTDTYVTWSPDGTKLAFNYNSGMISDIGSHIFIVNADGTDLTQVTHSTDNDGAPVWTK
jgi:Tol biopolymer transport system component